MKTLRFAVIGLGKQGSELSRALVRAGHTLVAVVGDTASHRKDFATKHGAAASYATLAQLFASGQAVDAVCVASPNDLHARHAIESLKRGAHVLCEKPLALTVREAQSIARTAKTVRRICAVDFQLRQHPGAQEARQLIRGGSLGDVRHIEMQWSIGSFGSKELPALPPHMRWRESVRRAGGGALMSRGVHLFDLLRFLTGREVDEVTAITDAAKGSVDRTAAVILRFGDVVATAVTSKRVPAAVNRVIIYGSQARLTLSVFDGGRGALEVQDGVRLRKQTYKPQDLNRMVINDFAGAVARHPFAGATADDGVATTAITSAVIASARTRRAQTVVRSSRGRLRGSTNTRMRRATRKA